jgi:hypothetical protein
MMRVNTIKKICLCFLLHLLSTNLLAQNAHFIYIQSDKGQAFYVRLNNKIFSSSDLGYLIIPKLQTGKLSLIIGFPMNKWNAMNYDIEIKEKDFSFQLKKVDSLNWELYDDHAQQMLPKNTIYQQRELIENNNDEFSNVLAEVINNPKIKQTRKVIKNVDSSGIKLNPKINEVEQLDSNQVDIDLNTTDKTRNRKVERKKEKQTIQKEFSFIDSTGDLLKYVIKDAGKIDTVSIFIPFDAKVKKSSQQVSEVENSPKDTIVKMQIKNPASENDFIHLRKQMILVENEERMIEISEKAFATSAYTTEMVKNLAVLFLLEKSKLTFLVTAYKYVSDKQNFKSLSTLLKEEINLSQFNHLFE